MKYITQQEKEIGYNARQKRYYLKNKDKILKKEKLWRLKNPNYQKEYHKRHYVKKVRIDTRLTLFCKDCGRPFKVCKSRIKYGAKFCSRDCFIKCLENHKVDPELRRIRLNKYQREYHKQKRLKSPEYRRKIGKGLIKTLKKYHWKRVKQERIKKRTYTCIQCGKTFFDKHSKKTRIYCSLKCQADAKRIYKNKAESRRAQKLRHPERKKNNKGITREAFNNIKAEYGYRCARCGRTEPFIDQYWIWLTQDHIISRKNGGRKRSKENIQPLCWDCNVLEKREQNAYYSPRLLLK